MRPLGFLWAAIKNHQYSSLSPRHQKTPKSTAKPQKDTNTIKINVKSWFLHTYNLKGPESNPNSLKKRALETWEVGGQGLSWKLLFRIDLDETLRNQCLESLLQTQAYTK